MIWIIKCKDLLSTKSRVLTFDNTNQGNINVKADSTEGNGLFSLWLKGYVMFGATFNLVTHITLP